MKKLLSLGIAAVSIAGLHAQDAPAPKPDDAPKPLPPLDQAAGPDHGPRPWMKKPFGKGGDRRGMWKGSGARMHGGKPPGRGPEGKGGPRFGHGAILAEELDLTPEQKEKAKAIMAAAKPKIQAIEDESRDKVKAVMQDAIKELRPILTPEQQAVLDDLQKLRTDREALKSARKAAKPDSEKTGDGN